MHPRSRVVAYRLPGLQAAVDPIKYKRLLVDLIGGLARICCSISILGGYSRECLLGFAYFGRLAFSFTACTSSLLKQNTYLSTSGIFSSSSNVCKEYIGAVHNNPTFHSLSQQTRGCKSGEFSPVPHVIVNSLVMIILSSGPRTRIRSSLPFFRFPSRACMLANVLW